VVGDLVFPAGRRNFGCSPFRRRHHPAKARRSATLFNEEMKRLIIMKGTDDVCAIAETCMRVLLDVAIGFLSRKAQHFTNWTKLLHTQLGPTHAPYRLSAHSTARRTLRDMPGWPHVLGGSIISRGTPLVARRGPVIRYGLRAGSSGITVFTYRPKYTQAASSIFEYTRQSRNFIVWSPWAASRRCRAIPFSIGESEWFALHALHHVISRS